MVIWLGVGDFCKWLPAPPPRTWSPFSHDSTLDTCRDGLYGWGFYMQRNAERFRGSWCSIWEGLRVHIHGRWSSQRPNCTLGMPTPFLLSVFLPTDGNRLKVSEGLSPLKTESMPLHTELWWPGRVLLLLCDV